MSVYIVRDIYDDAFFVFSTLAFAEEWIQDQPEPLAWFVDEFEVMR